MSAVENTGEVPSFADRVGERLVVAQPSGALLEFLHFHPELSSATFFEAAVKARLKRLSNFRHPSYARAARLQRDASRGGGLTLVSTYAPGRRLADVLALARRGRILPRLSAVLSLTKQLMTAAALLHDYAPDVFHGALGPDRLVIGSDGRLVITEYVLGDAVEQAVAEWGQVRLWREYRLAMPGDTSLARYGRRADLLQIGLVALSLLLGRPLSANEFPGGLQDLLDQARETMPEGDSAPLGASLKEWLGRLLSLDAAAAFKTLVEAQKAFGRMVEEEPRYGVSSVAVEVFFQQCEEAALLPVVPTESGAAAIAAPGGEAAGSTAGAAVATEPVPAAVADTPPAAGGDVLLRESSPAEDLLAVAQEPEPASVAPDPFTPWPVVVGSETVATLFDTFKPQVVRDAHAVAIPEAVLPEAPTAAQALVAAPPPADGSAAAGEAAAEARRHGPARRATDPPQMLFESVPLPPIETAASAAGPVLEPAAAGAPAATAAPRTMGAVSAASERRALTVLSYDQVHKQRVKRRSPMVAVAAVAAIVVVVAAAIAVPRLWSRLRPGRAAAPTTATADVAKSAETGGFKITTQPAGCRITIDGKPRGKAPLTVNDLAPGLHSITVESDWGSVDEAVTVEAGKILPLGLATVGWIKVVAPVQLHVSEQGKSFGTTGDGPVMVPAGRHHFDLINQAVAVRLRQFVEVPPGASVNVPVELPAGMLNLNSDQPAQVLLDGQVIGDTPLISVPAPLGSHEVIFRSQKYGDVSYTVNVTLAAPVRLTVNFAKR